MCTCQSRVNAINTPDYLPVEILRKLQWQKFQAVLNFTYSNVAWYREKMKEKGVKPEDIRSLDDVKYLPTIVKTDLRDTYPFGMMAVDMKEIVRVHASSGTTGKPIVLPYTRKDLAVWTESIARGMAGVGLTDRDVLQVSYGYGLFTGGLGAHQGGEFLGATVVPMSGGNTERQLNLMLDFGVTAIACTPSYFVHLISKAEEMGFDWKKTKLRLGFFGAEPWTNEMRRNIEQTAGIKAYDIYGLTEISGPGVALDCVCQSGPHIFEDHFYPEILDPDTLEPVPDGEYGELTFTTLDKQGMPLIRYRTRDITRLIPEKCECGRTIRRFDRISHRSDDMMIIRGVNVFPGQIEAALLSVEGAVPHYQILLTRDASGLDNIEVQVEISADKFSDTHREIDQFQRQVAAKIQHVTGIRIGVTLVEPGRIPRSEGKARRVIDNRNK
ncbi:MAG: phenylacetate--CoA ligase [Thermoguttaceae bacterium]|nr:phenylacetate--CoA ligase [Thermoguttaceae bacterium]